MAVRDPVAPAEAINPYAIALALMIRRLAWDVSPEAWRSRAMLRRIRDVHRGKSAVILCNGPSLLKTDFESILRSGAFVFGLNKVNLLYDKTALRPNAIVAVNEHVIEQNQSYYNETSIPLYLDKVARANVPARDNVVFLHSANIRRFAKDCSLSISQGHTVTYVALQLAYHMGFARVALVGCDHNFAQSGRANRTVVAGQRDDSHFDPRYFANGMQWQLPDLLQSEVHYLLAREAYESDGRLLVNCTEGGKLEIFQRLELHSFLAGSH